MSYPTILSTAVWIHGRKYGSTKNQRHNDVKVAEEKYIIKG